MGGWNKFKRFGSFLVNETLLFTLELNIKLAELIKQPTMFSSVYQQML